MKGDADSPHRRTGARSAEPTWLTLGQAAKYLGIAQSTVRVWTDSGRLPVFYTPGGHRRFLRSDLDAFIQRNGAGSRPRGDAVVLVVDDNPKLRSFIRVNLEFDGMVVREAATAEEGLAALDEDPPDLVMLDVNLPGIDGWEMLRRVRERHGIDTLPVIMFCIVFGLSMDYEVLLLSRMQEEWNRTHDNRYAVAEGLERIGRLITGAAGIMVGVFLAFALAEVVIIKAIGLGMAIAVAIDATLVRALVVPATMRLLGDLNWWAPRPLARLYRRLGLGEASAPRPLIAAAATEAD